MSTRATTPPAVLRPAEAAAQLGLTVAGLVALIRKYRYEFTELSPGGKPGDRGRNRWGLSQEQLRAILRGQRRTPAEPEAAPVAIPESPDGKTRLRESGRGRI